MRCNCASAGACRLVFANGVSVIVCELAPIARKTDPGNARKSTPGAAIPGPGPFVARFTVNAVSGKPPRVTVYCPGEVTGCPGSGCVAVGSVAMMVMMFCCEIFPVTY